MHNEYNFKGVYNQIKKPKKYFFLQNKRSEYHDFHNCFLTHDFYFNINNKITKTSDFKNSNKRRKLIYIGNRKS